MSAAAANKSDKLKAAKKAKDPNAPKRPLTAYFLWLKENRESIKKPGMAVTEVTKVAGGLWRELDQKEKDVWQKRADDEKLKYAQAVDNYEKSKDSAAASGDATHDEEDSGSD